MSKANKEMRDECDFKGKKGVHGKYHEAFKNGYSVRVYKEDGSIDEQYYASIEADVHKYFPNSQAINEALRSLIKQ